LPIPTKEINAMSLPESDHICKPVRRTLPTRRNNRLISIECEGHSYRATAGWFDDGQLAEIFLDAPGKMGTPLQANADTAAILTSLLLQHGVDPEVILHSITGPIAIALQKFMVEAPCARTRIGGSENSRGTNDRRAIRLAAPYPCE
jgi:hypothetical protein